MGHSNRTPVCRLPQFTDDDKPSWLGDMNEAFATLEKEIVADRARIAELQAQIVTLQAKVIR